MNQQKIAKHLIELNEAHVESSISAASMFQSDSEKCFFRFVDKNPLFIDNSPDAVYEYLAASRRLHHQYHDIADENPEVTARYFCSDHSHKRDK